MKKFEVPTHYRSSFIGEVKELRKINDPRKRDFTPTLLDFGPVQFLMARHFGFCYGVENAIEISYRTVEQNQGKRIFLLSQMIHNPLVNKDLENKGVRFIMDTMGNQIIPWSELKAEDIVLTPAFGTTLEIEKKLRNTGIQIENYDTTCPFVKKVWTMSDKLGDSGATVIIHGKAKHEETRATFSHSKEKAPSVVVLNMEEAELLSEYIIGQKPEIDFYEDFKGKYSEGFDPKKHFDKVGVVNQTTMLATETHEISEFLKGVMIKKYGAENLNAHFTDTRDTLCYATNDNQEATKGLLQSEADFAIVVGGYNSSNTSHLVELLEEKFKTFYISDVSEIKSDFEIQHYNFRNKTMQISAGFIPSKPTVRIILSSGASCPDAAVDAVLDRILGVFRNVKSKEKVLAEL
jgi:4-hydroxy-3-methylbut-2-enyl diphosphate reductase